MPNMSLTPSEDAQKLLVSYLDICYNRFNIDTVRTRYERVDRAIQLEEESRREKVPDYYDDIIMPVVKPPVRKIANFLIDIFVSNPTLFEMVSGNPENAEIVKQFNAIIEENSKTSKWSREMVLFLKDLPKYNVAGMLTEWVESSVTVVANSSDPASVAADVSVASRAGNVLTHLDMYNTFYDTVVDISEVGDKGDFIGTIEKMTSNRLHKYLEDLKLTLGITTLLNEDKIFNSNGISNRWYRPQINTKASGKEELTAMQQLFQGIHGTTDTTKGKKGGMAHLDPAGMHEMVMLFVRIVPSMFGLKAAQPDKIQMFKLHVLNWNTLVAVESITNAHNTFPATLCQIDEEGIDDQVKSAAELLVPLQNLTTKLYDARMQGLKRNISDRALYSTSRIDKKHFKSDNPSAKIPVKPNILSPSLDDAYRQIPFQDNLGVTMMQELNYLDRVAQKTSGLNDPQQGMFQKGNKTLGEFNEVMANADDDLRTWAKLVEVSGIGPIKYQCKLNILQYQAATSITAGGGEATQIDPTQLRSIAAEFKMADGLISKENLMDLPTARSFFELLLQSPQLQAFYGQKLPQLVEYVFSSIGFDTSKFAGGNPAALAAPAPAAAAPTPT